MDRATIRRSLAKEQRDATESPTLRDVRGLVRDAIRAALPGSDATPANSVLRVLSDAMGALCHLTLQYIDWLALQLLPDTAEVSAWIGTAKSGWSIPTALAASTGHADGSVPVATGIANIVPGAGRRAFPSASRRRR